ncbi:lipoprotein-anchoring transpeptidase ErfK/SrfK [Actinoalloteichus hoggarensis]|uniref:L,D-transpeptidase catalytic domain n=1 Tax=Actinoalloteichus hoggarensis TaxID=1470176 RepID=A0A221W943_9PSEU|nr:L,D-transpeptidase [Actinoalloteichus hoggarensis]ASO22458.1 L,D-transpeptidase catalytic domain [Actinoalloteichus hoggarensis]MBB5923118.1 lipoprotein-anchoring transpeptidase ErfK/SrfK [Actinoalloteichus hoggarensis]
MTPAARGQTAIRNRVLALCAAATLTLLAAGCGQDAIDEGADTRPPVTTRPVDLAALAALPEATTFGVVDSAPTDAALGDAGDGTAGGDLVIRPEEELPVYDTEGGEAIARLPVTQLGSPTWLPVVEQRGDWYHVLLPSKPNNSSGWLNAADGAVTEATNAFRVIVDVDEFSLAVLESGTEIGRWTVGVGSSEAPTPLGRTFLLASIEETVSEFSRYTLPLGTHSEVLETYSDGPATVAIHGWPDETPFGTETSDGCVRVPDAAMDLLLTLPLGTVVDIR